MCKALLGEGLLLEYVVFVWCCRLLMLLPWCDGYDVLHSPGWEQLTYVQEIYPKGLPIQSNSERDNYKKTSRTAHVKRFLLLALLLLLLLLYDSLSLNYAIEKSNQKRLCVKTFVTLLLCHHFVLVVHIFSIQIFYHGK